MAPKRKSSTETLSNAKKKSKAPTAPLEFECDPEPSNDPSSIRDAPQDTDFHKMLEVKKSALLGFAIMSFVDLKDMGKGLSVEIQKFNPRTATPTQIDTLIVAMGGDPNDLTKEFSQLNRFSPENAMFMLVKSKYLELDTLRKDPFSNEFRQVRWSPLAKEPTTTDVAYLINGNTRREVCVRLGQKPIEDYKTLRAKFKHGKYPDHDQKKMEKQCTLAAYNIRASTSWIVAFFDQGDLIHLLVSTLADKNKKQI